MNMFRNQVTPYRTALGKPFTKPDTSHLHPGEFGRVSSWVKKSLVVLALEKPIYGFSPAVIFDEREPMFIDIETVNTPDGMQDPDAGNFYTMTEDGTPLIRRNISFTPAAMEAGAQSAGGNDGPAQAPVRPDVIKIANPEFVPNHKSGSSSTFGSTTGSVYASRSNINI
jgi:hypothetical protein